MSEIVNYSAVAVPKPAVKSYAEHLSNWRTAHAFVSTLPENSQSVRIIGQLLSLELKNKDGPRHHVLNRLHMTLNRMRGRIESKTLLKYATRN